MTPARTWPVATPFRSNALSLAPVIEAEFSGAQLRELARWLGATPKDHSRAGLVEQVVTALNERIARVAESPDALLEGLSDAQQHFARRLLTARDPEVPVAYSAIADLWTQSAKHPSRSSWPYANRQLTEMLESLRRRALLFPTRAPFPTSAHDSYYQWLPMRRAPVMRWPASAEATTREVAGPSSPTANFLEHFQAFLDAIARSGAALRARLPPHQQAARLSWLRGWEHNADEAERVLRSRPNWAPDPHTGISVPMLSPLAAESLTTLENQTGLPAPQIEFLFAIACALQLIEATDPDAPAPQATDGAGRVRVRNEALEAWLSMDDQQQLRRAWTAWSEQIMDGLEVRSAIGDPKPEPSFRVMRAIGARALTPNLLAAEWCALRRYMVRVLRSLPLDRWIRWDTLQEQLFDFHPECTWTFATKASWWFAYAAKGTRVNLKVLDEWRLTLGAILEHIIRDSLAWFGAVEARPTPAGRLDAFKITPLGEWFIEGREEPPPISVARTSRPIEPIEWLDEYTLRLPPAPDRAALVGVVRRCTEHGSAPFTYTFTAASIERALSEGLSFADVAAQFKRARAPLSRTVSNEFKRIAQRHGRVRVYQSLTVLELADDFAARELAASTSLMQYVVYQLSPRTFVLNAEGLDRLIGELLKKGYTPRVK
ncbi:helicase-associated domain-containing protein [Candidatus Roseilinea sp. NK_OTU-006]|jgi:hypothetical protein|nr:helicase-associated domain-containing protein [Candidatus Roseilinea sp. NK_OTU-006]